MPATTVNRAYPYPLDADPIDTAGDVGRLAIAVDVDTKAQWDASIWQDSQITQHDGEIQQLMNCRPRLYTDYVAQFDKMAIDCRIYYITTDGNGNGGATWATPFASIPTVQCMITVEGQGHYYRATIFQANTTTAGWAFNAHVYNSQTVPNSAFEIICLGIGTY